jgi:phage baseplate assembly protein W
MSNVATASASTLGSDVSWFPDLDPNLALVSGNACLAQALWQRLSTVRGTFPWDPEYGLYVAGLFNETIQPSTLPSWQRQIAAECEKDERVFAATVTIAQLSQTQLTITIVCEIAGGPFTLTLGVSAVTVALLSFTS